MIARYLSGFMNPGIRDVFRMGVRDVFAYRVWLYLGIIQVFFQLVLIRAIWQAVYGDQHLVNGISVDQMLVYLTMAALLGFMIRPNIADEIHERIDQGRVAIDMVRPIGFIRQMVVLELGTTTGRWLLLIVIVPGLLLLGQLTPPSTGAFVAFLFSVVLAYVVSVLIWLLVGLSAFWFINISGMQSVVFLVSGFFAGFMVPLWFMPEPLRTLAEWLPFQSINFLPASIYVGEATGGAMWRVLGIQAFWIVALTAIAQWTWHRARLRIVIQGG